MKNFDESYVLSRLASVITEAKRTKRRRKITQPSDSASAIQPVEEPPATVEPPEPEAPVEDSVEPSEPEAPVEDTPTEDTPDTSDTDAVIRIPHYNNPKTKFLHTITSESVTEILQNLTLLYLKQNDRNLFSKIRNSLNTSANYVYVEDRVSKPVEFDVRGESSFFKSTDPVLSSSATTRLGELTISIKTLAKAIIEASSKNFEILNALRPSSAFTGTSKDAFAVWHRTSAIKQATPDAAETRELIFFIDTLFKYLSVVNATALNSFISSTSEMQTTQKFSHAEYGLEKNDNSADPIEATDSALKLAKVLLSASPYKSIFNLSVRTNIKNFAYFLVQLNRYTALSARGGGPVTTLCSTVKSSEIGAKALKENGNLSNFVSIRNLLFGKGRVWLTPEIIRDPVTEIETIITFDLALYKHVRNIITENPVQAIFNPEKINVEKHYTALSAKKEYEPAPTDIEDIAALKNLPVDVDETLKRIISDLNMVNAENANEFLNLVLLMVGYPNRSYSNNSGIIRLIPNGSSQTFFAKLHAILLADYRAIQQGIIKTPSLSDRYKKWKHMFANKHAATYYTNKAIKWSAATVLAVGAVKAKKIWNNLSSS